MSDIIVDTLLDCVKLIPFLFAAYLFIEFVEHKASAKSAELINKAGKFGPLAGAVLGIVPQCGFSAVMSNFYAGGLITKGTLLAVFLSTSDEMLPILLSENVPACNVIKILIIKVFIALIAGTAIDIIIRKMGKVRHASIADICGDGKCCCKDGIFRSALHHTIETALFISIVTFALNTATYYIGEEAIAGLMLNKPIIGELIAGMIGLIPNCASSVLITEMYVEGYLSAGAMLSGLCVGSGVGLLVLFRVNKDVKDSLKILCLLYFIGTVFGFVFGKLPVF